MLTLRLRSLGIQVHHYQHRGRGRPTSACKSHPTPVPIAVRLGTNTGFFLQQISYLSTSQGFEWNPELFLPSYIDYDYTPLENKREPVKEITLTDEEIQNMFPRN